MRLTDVGSLSEWLLAAFAAFATIGSSYLLIRSGRRDNAQNEREAAKKRLDKHAVEIRHTQRETKVEPFYDGDL